MRDPALYLAAWDHTTYPSTFLTYLYVNWKAHAPYFFEERPVEGQRGDARGVVTEPVVPPRLPKVTIEGKRLRILVDGTHCQYTQVDRHPGGRTSDLR